MGSDHHLRSDHYVLAAERRMSRGTLAVRLHQHLVELCTACRADWQQVADGQGAVQRLLVDAAVDDAPTASPAPVHHGTAFSWQAKRLEAEVRRIRRVRSEACKTGWELLQQDQAERLRRVEVAVRRYRSRAEAEYVLEKAREVIRDDPVEAERRASLVLEILHRSPVAHGSAWAPPLEARARAWIANARRVAGDLTAAEQLFSRLRRDLAREPLHDPGVLAEVARLEASLRTDQDRLAEAHQLLDLASLLCRGAGDVEGEVRILIKQGNLFNYTHQPREALASFERAATRLLDAKADPYLDFCVVNGRVVSLCEMERYREAAVFLDAHLDVYEETDQLHAGALLRYHRGRIARGQGRLEDASTAFAEAQEGYLAADRRYDAALAALDRAETLAAQGKHRELQVLSAQLVQLFRSQGVGRHALAAVRLLARASRTVPVQPARLADLRKRLRSSPEL